MPTLAPDDAPIGLVAKALDEYRRQMWLMHDLARAAERIEGLPDTYKALAAAIVKLSGLRPHRIHGEAGPDDARALSHDLEAICLAVDPLVEAYGLEARLNFRGVDERLFDGVLTAGLEGFALIELECAAERTSPAHA